MGPPSNVSCESILYVKCLSYNFGFFSRLNLRITQKLCEEDTEILEYAKSLKQKGLVESFFIDEIKGCVKVKKGNHIYAITEIKQLEELAKETVPEDFGDFVEDIP